MKTSNRFFALAALLAFTSLAIAADKTAPDRITRDTVYSSEGIELTSKDCLSTPGSFQPPVEITIIAKTDSHDLRMAYAADQVIFNWGDNPSELRVDGGPANGLHKAGAGAIPAGKYVAIRWVVTAGKQSIYVNNELRYEQQGDYSLINRNVSVFPVDSKVTVKSIQVKRLPTDTR